MKKAIALAFAIVVAVGATAAFAKPTAKASASATTAVSCNNAKIAMIAPLTGVVGFLGQAQLSWAKYAVKTLNPSLGLKVKLLEGDMQLDSSVAATLAQKYVGDPSVMAIIGPSTSGGVVAVGPALTQAKLAAIGNSATRTSLTKGDGRIQSFWRVTADDSVQGTRDAQYMKKLGAKKVVVIDDQETYSTGLADYASSYLKKNGVTVIRESVSQSVTDFSSLVTKVPGDADFVFLPWQVATNGQIFAQQMAEQGKKAKIFGSDGLDDPAFKLKGAYVSSFSPDVATVPAAKSIVAGWLKDNPGKTPGSFGPPSYGATNVALVAIQKACKAKGGKITRADVYFRMNSVRIKNWFLGGSFRFSTKTHDPLNGNFYIFQLNGDGTKKQVSP